MDNIGILKINELAEKTPGMARFDKGSGRFPFPTEFLSSLDSVKEAVRGKYFHYPQTGGERSLREAIAKWEVRNGRDLKPENITVTAGGMSGLFTFFSLLTRPGDEIITSRTAFEGFTNLAGYFSLRQKRVDLSDIKAVERAITGKTRAVIFNSPENPTGRVYSAEETNNLVELTRRKKVWLLSDEVMNQVIYKGSSWTGPSLREKHVVVINSFSKMWFLSGIRVGWLACINKEVSEAFANFLSIQSTGVSLFGQLLIDKVLRGIDFGNFLKKRLDILEKRRNLVATELKKGKLSYIHDVDGGMNYYVDLRKDSSKVILKLMKEERVALIPGYLFEGKPTSYARLGFGAVNEDEIVRGIASISSVLSR